MTRTEQLAYGNYYHIYNCGINGCDLFSDEKDYLRFLSSYKKYLKPVFDTLAWCLMRNHFHLLIRVKSEDGILPFHDLIHNQDLQPLAGVPTQGKSINGADEKWLTRKPIPFKQLSHLFNSYAQYFNRKYQRHGGLFEKPFRRKLIDNESYLKKVMVYIHTNPIHHGFADGLLGYPWTSYLGIVQDNSDIGEKESGQNLFGTIDNFKFMHKEKVDVINMNHYLEI